jgi:L-erythro-3,5-diaminohexanoate dehydrogenase
MSEIVPVEGHAILPIRAPIAIIPDDIDELVALAVLDVCGAPAWVARLCPENARVVVVGAGGKSGMLATAQALESAGRDGRVLGACWPPGSERMVIALGAEAIIANGTEPLSFVGAVHAALGGPADLVVVCANAPGCEPAAVLTVSPDGTVLFFSMATSFTAAALAAESVAQPCRMIIGNGYAVGHADLALGLLRRHAALREWFMTSASRAPGCKGREVQRG